jgi:hypothetical protein
MRNNEAGSVRFIYNLHTFCKSPAITIIAHTMLNASSIISMEFPSARQIKITVPVGVRALDALAFERIADETT